MAAHRSGASYAHHGREEDDLTLQVIGAGLPRTGTMSLKAGLERLLGGPCYHMLEVFMHPDHVPLWDRALDGGADWAAILDSYVAAVDYPVSSFWSELASAYPDAVIVWSVRDAESWWRSCDATILNAMRGGFEPSDEAQRRWLAMARRLMVERLTPDFLDPAAAMAAHDRHDAEVRATAPAGRLVEWRATDGWGPLCEALGVDVPDEPFPHLNTTEEFVTRQRPPD